MNNLISNKIKKNVGNNPEHPDFNDAGLAWRMQVTPATIRAWRCRSPEKLPPGGLQIGRNWLYSKQVVEKWMSEQRDPALLLSTQSRSKNDGVSCSKRARGRPRKFAKIKAKLAGVAL